MVKAMVNISMNNAVIFITMLACVLNKTRRIQIVSHKQRCIHALAVSSITFIDPNSRAYLIEDDLKYFYEFLWIGSIYFWALTMLNSYFDHLNKEMCRKKPPFHQEPFRSCENHHKTPLKFLKTFSF